jgi:hypothetical protein
MQATKLIMAHMSKEPFEVVAWPLVALAVQVSGAVRVRTTHTKKEGCVVLTSAARASVVRWLCIQVFSAQIANHFFRWLDPVLLGYSVNAGGPAWLLVRTCSPRCSLHI